MLKKETIEELKKILEKDYKQELSIQEASESANALVRFFDLLTETYYQNKIQKNHKTKKSSVNS